MLPIFRLVATAPARRPGDLHVERLEDRTVLTFLGGVSVASGDWDADGFTDIVTGAGPGGGPHVRVFSGQTGQPVVDLFAYDPAFAGGVTVAVGDVTGDGRLDLITGAGPGGGPHVKVFDGLTLQPVFERMAYDPSFAGGVNVAAADLDGDGRAEVITGAGVGGGPHVRAFSVTSGQVVRDFFAFDPAATGGVSVAAGDITGDGAAEIVAGYGPGGPALVRAFGGPQVAEVFSVVAYEPEWVGGTRVAVGDVDGDGRGEVLTGAMASGGPRLRAFFTNGDQHPMPLGSFFAYDQSFRGGVFLAAADVDADGKADVITGAGAGGGPHVRAFRSVDLTPLADFMAYDPDLRNGRFATAGSGRSRVALDLFDTDRFLAEEDFTFQIPANATGRTSLILPIPSLFPNGGVLPDGSVSPDVVNLFLVDADDESRTLVDQGTEGTPFLTVSAAGGVRPAVEGGVRFDGETAFLDLPVPAPKNAILRAQIVNLDGRANRRVTALRPAFDVGTDGPLFPASESAAVSPSGPVTNADALPVAPNVRAELSNVRFDSGTKLFTSDLVLVNDGSAAVGRNLIVRFPDLPAGVTLANPSNPGGGRPYISVKDAAPVGGLGAGERTAPVKLEIENPGQELLSLRAEVSAGENTPPVLGDPGALWQVTPGDLLDRVLPVGDEDGDTLTLSVQVKRVDDSTTPDFPLFQFDAKGQFRVTARPGQEGDYELLVTLTDGAAVVTRTVPLRVLADADTRTRVTGVVLDTGNQPLGNVRVAVVMGNSPTAPVIAQGSTDANGVFAVVPTTTDTTDLRLRVFGNELTAPTAYHYVDMPLTGAGGFLGRTALFPTANNRIINPVYLQALDTPNAVTVDPSRVTYVKSSVPGLYLTIPAGSLKVKGTSQNYTGRVALTVVQNQRTPMPLATEFLPDYVVTFQPVLDAPPTPGSPPLELVFANDRSGVLTQPYSGPLPAGSEFELIGFDESGMMQKVGDARVADAPLDPTNPSSPRQAALVTAGGTQGLRTGSCDFYVPPKVPVNTNTNPATEDDGCVSCKLEVQSGSSVEMHSGALHEGHALATYQSLGVTRGVSLSYDSLRADPRPLVNFGAASFPALSSDVAARTRLVARMELTRDGQTTRVDGAARGPRNPDGREHFWTVAAGQDSYQAVLQADLRGRPTGRYQYAIDAGLLVTVDGRLRGRTAQETGELFAVNEIDSVFGAGWGVAGLQKLVVESPAPGLKNADGTPDEGGVLLVDGDGTQMFFRKKGTTYTAPAGDFSTLVLAGGRFTRTLPDGTRYQFDDFLDLVSVSDRNGNTTTYRHRAPGEILEIEDPVGLKTTFTYGANNKVVAITNPDGRQTLLGYDAVGNLRAVTDPDGATRTWSYDSGRRMTSEQDARGSRETTTYNAAGRVAESRLKDGTVKRFSPLQSQAFFSPARTTSFDAAPSVRPFTSGKAFVADANGNVTEYTLDRAGQTVTSRDWEGKSGRVERTPANLVGQAFDARGNFTRYTYDAKGNPLTRKDIEDEVRILAHNSNNPALYWIDPLNAAVTPIGNMAENGRAVTLFDIAFRDGSGYFGLSNNGVIYRVNAQTAAVTTVGNTGASGLVALAFAPDGVLYAAGDRLYVIDPATGRATPQGTATFGGRRASGDIEFDSAGNLFVTFDGGGGSVLGRVDRATGALTPVGTGIGGGFGQVFGLATSFAGLFGLTENGQLIRIDTSTGAGTLVAPFGGTNTVSQIGGGTVVVSAPGPFESMTYDPTFSQLTEMVDELGRRTVYDVDPTNGNTRSVTRVMGLPDGTPGDTQPDLTTRNTFLPSGQIDTVTDPLGRVTDYDYDPLGRLVAVTAALGTPDQTTSRYEYLPGDLSGNVRAMVDGRGNRTVYEYDAMNRVVRVTEPDPDGSGPQTSPVSEMTYDKNGNMVGSRDALGAVTLYAYDPLNRRTAAAAPDPDGAGPLTSPVTTMRYEANGNLRAVTDPNGNTTQYRYDERQRRIGTFDPDGGVTLFGYDADGNMTSLKDPGGNVTRFDYDFRGRQISEIDPLGAVTRYTYDAADRLAAVTDRIGRSTYYAYDDADRVTSESWDDGSNIIRYAYDLAGNLVRLQDGYSTLTFTPDNLNRTRAVSNAGTPGAPVVDLTYAHDTNGNVRSVTDSLGGTTTHEYDALDRVVELTQAGTGVTPKRALMGYNALGQTVALERYANNQLVMSSAFGYDGMHRLTAITHGSAQFFAYQYDAGSRITQIANKNEAVNFAYDRRDQLAAADYLTDSQTDERYRYDANGNRLESQRHGTAYTTDANTANRLRTDGTYRYDYDANGNMVRRTSMADGTYREFAWDHRNRLRALTDRSAGGIITKEVVYTYDALDRRIAQTSGGVTQQYVYDREDVLFEFNGGTLATRNFHGPGIDQVLAQENNGAVQWLLTDHLGSTRGVVAANGAVQLVEYDAYGNPQTALPTRYGFTGREWDAGAGMWYYRARYYDAQAGTFVSEDPFGYMSGDTLLYRYTLNAPVLYTDPSGHIIPLLPILAGMAIGGAIGSGIGAGVAWLSGGDVQQGAIVGGVSGAVGVLGGAAGLAAARGVGLVGAHTGAYLPGIIAGGSSGLSGSVAAQVYMDCDISVGETLMSTALGAATGGMFSRGPEFVFPKRPGWPERIAPFGNRTQNPFGEFPHYHRRVPNPLKPNQSLPGQGVGNHRPWEGGF